MGAGIGHAVDGVVVGQVFAVLPRVAKAELQHLHAGKARVRQQLVHLRGEKAQVLGNDGPGAQAAAEGPEEVHPRPGQPLAVPGGLLPVGDGVIGFKAPEVVQPQHVVNFELKGHPVQPPGVAVLFHPVPPEQRVAPQLAVGGVVVRGHPGHQGGAALVVQQELLRGGPHVGAVPGDIDGQVAHDGDALSVDIGLEFLPLAKEEVLHPLPEADVVLQLFFRPGHGPGAAEADVLRPLQPGGAAVPLFQGHKQGIVIQPGLVEQTEPVKGRRGAGEQPVAGTPQHRQPQAVEGLIVHPLRVVPPGEGGVLLPLQQPLPLQLVQVDEIGVARPGGEGLIGGVPIPRGADGQDLPMALPAPGQKVRKFPGLPPQGANPVGRGEGEDGHQNARAPHRHGYRRLSKALAARLTGSVSMGLSYPLCRRDARAGGIL